MFRVIKKFRNYLGQLDIRSIRHLRLRTYIALGLILILLPIVIFSLFSASDSEAGWFDMAWGFRKRVPVTNSTGSNQTDFQVMITLDTATLVTAGKIQNDCDDLRVTDINGKVLPQWIEPNTCNTTETLIWVKVPTVHSSGTDLYVYYGNPSASAAASGTDNVFIRDMESAVAAWPMQETDANQSYAEAKHPGVDEGRNIVINGGFDTDTVWSKSGAEVTLSGGKLLFTDAPAGRYAEQAIPISPGKTYTITYTIETIDTGAISIQARLGTLVNGTQHSSAGTYTDTLTNTTATSLMIRVSGGSGDAQIDNVSVKQIDIPGSNDFDGSELLTNGDFTAWTGDNPDNWIVVGESGSDPAITEVGSGETHTGTGTGSANIYSSASANLPFMYQDVMTVGKTYQVTINVSLATASGSDVVLRVDSLGTNNKYYTASELNGQTITYLFTATDSRFGLRLSSGLPIELTIDSVSLTEISPLSGAIPASGNRPTVATTASGHLSQAYSFDGSNDYVSIYSSDLNSVFNPDEGTLLLWVKVSGSSVWTDGTLRRIGYLSVNDNNRVFIYKSSASNQINYAYVANGVSQGVAKSTTDTNWMQLAITWNKTNDEVKAFFNGNQEGSTQTGMGDWTGNLHTNSTNIGAENNSGLRSFSGLINDVRLYNRALTADEISNLYHASEDREAYYTDNYEGHELIRKYNTGVSTGTFGDEEAGPGPVAEWKLDEGQGQEAKDSTSNGNDGQLGSTSSSDGNDPTWVPEDRCISGKCLEFDGGDGIRLNSNLDVGTTHTLSGWFKQSSNQTGSQVVVGGSDTNSYGLLISEGNALYYKAQTNSVNTSQTISPNIWYHFSVVRSGTSILFYLNGNEVDSKTLGADVSNTIRAIGSTNATATFFNGFIDEVKVYPYARTEAQIKEDYNQGAAVLGLADQGSLSDGLVGYWTMDETSGTTVADKSGNGNNGTLTNAQESGTSDASGNTTTTLVDTDGANLSTTDDAYNGMILRFTEACGSITSDTERVISDYTGASKTFTITTALPAAPDSCAYEIRHQVGGKFGNGIQFDGNGDYWRSNSSSIINPSAGSISLWVSTSNLQSSTGYYILSHPLISEGNRIYLRTNSTGTLLQAEMGTGATVGSKTVTSNSWNHVTITWNGTSTSFFVNGTDVTTNSNFNGLSASTHLYMSTWNGSNQHFAGKVDELRVYNRALSPGEVKQLYQWAPGPVGYWDFEEGSGTTAFDKSGNGNNGSITGASYTQGKYGKALSFDGTSAYVQVSDNTDFDFGVSGSFTYSLWAKRSGLSNRDELIDYNNASSHDQWSQIGSDGKVHLQMRDADGTACYTSTTTSVISDTDWHHIGIMRDVNSGSIRYFVDGIEKASTSCASGIYRNMSIDGNIGIGVPTDSLNEFMDGLLDDVRIYNYARTPEQIRQDMQGSGQSTAAGADPLPQPVAHWSFDEMQGQTAHDSAGSNDGTLGADGNASTDDPTWTSGKVNGALSFDGGDYMNIGNKSQLNITSAISVSAWVKGASFTTWDQIAGKWQDSSNGYALYTGSSASHALFQVGVDGNKWQLEGTSTINDGNWHHVVGTYDGTTLKLFVDGKLDNSSTTYSGPITTNTVSATVGARSNGTNDKFTGLIDEVKIYNTALSAEQVRQDMNASSTLSFGGVAGASEAADMADGEGNPPVAYWDFEEGSGTTLVSDKSGNGVDLTMNGSMTNENWVLGKIGKGLDFDDTNDTLSNATPPIFMDDSFSISAWIKPDDLADDQGIFNEGSPWTSNTKGFSISYRSTGTLFTRLNNGTNAYTDASTTIGDITGDWHHLAVVVNNDTSLTYYLDGKDIGSHNISTQAGSYDNGTLYLGRYASGIYFDGQIDQVKIYDYARTPAQIAYDYNRGAPIAHWKFNECEGSAIHDSSGNENHGTLTVTTDGGNSAGVGSCNTASSAWGSGASGKYGSSLNFDGNGDYVDMGTSFNLTQPYSFAAWVKTTGGGSQNIIGNFNTGVRAGPYLMVASGILTFGDSGSIDGNTSINNGSWHHVAMTGTGSTVNLYVDGKLDATGTVTLTANTTDNFLIGARYTNSLPSQLFNGQIDDVQIYNYALSAAQVRKLYNQNSAIRFGE